MQLVLLAAVIGFAPAPQIVADFGGATVEIAADRAWMVLPGQCATVRWDLEGIESVYVNDEGKVGHDEMSFCPTQDAFTVNFNITAADGRSQTFPLSVHDLASYVIDWLLMLGLLLPLIAAIWYLAAMRISGPPFPVAFVFLVSLALLLAGLLLQAARPTIVSDALAQLAAITPTRRWQQLGSVLAAVIFIPLGIELFRRRALRSIRADLIAISACFAVLALLRSQGGFDSISEWEIWSFQAYLEGRFSVAGSELISRFWILVPHTVASTISWSSFAGYHLVNLLMMWGSVAFVYGILRQLGAAPWLAFLAGILFLAYPVNSHLMSLRSFAFNFGQLALLAAIFLALAARSNVSRLRLLGIWLTLLFCLGSHETGFVILLVIPLLWWIGAAGFWPKANLTLIWYLVPIAKAAHVLLLNRSSLPLYGSWYFEVAPVDLSLTLENVIYYLDIIANAYMRTFVYGWQEALDAISLNNWLLPTTASIALVGFVSAYLARDSFSEGFASRKNILLAFAGGFAFILPAIGVVMWLAPRAYGLWRMYVFVPLGAAIALLALVALAALPVKDIRLRKGLIIGCVLLLSVPGLSRLYVQQGAHVARANAKARILLQIVEQAPYFNAEARLLLFTDMTFNALQEKGVAEFRTNMFDSARYMMYQEGAPSLAFLCVQGKFCGGDDILIQRDFLESSRDFSDIVIFRLHHDLRVELLRELPPELFNGDQLNYDPLSLIDASAPPPPRALTLLSSVRRA